jgi:hypothetical protein
MTIRDPGDLLGAALSGLCVLAAVALLSLMWAQELPRPRTAFLIQVAYVSLAAAVLATALSYYCNVRWS